MGAVHPPHGCGVVMNLSLFGSGIVLPYQLIQTRSKSTAPYRTSRTVPCASTASSRIENGRDLIDPSWMKMSSTL